MESPIATCIVSFLLLGLLKSVVGEANPVLIRSPYTSLPKDFPKELIKLAGILQSKDFTMVYALGGDGKQGVGDFAIIPKKQTSSQNDIQPMLIRVNVLKMNDTQVEELREYISLAESQKSENQSSESFQQDDESPPDSLTKEDFIVADNVPEEEHHVESHTLPAPVLHEAEPVTKAVCPPYVIIGKNVETEDEWRSRLLGRVCMIIYFAIMGVFVLYCFYSCFQRLCSGCADEFEDLLARRRNNQDSVSPISNRGRYFTNFEKKSNRWSAYERI